MSNTAFSQAFVSLPLTVANGGTGATTVTTIPTASAFAGWDANKNFTANNLINSFTTTATAAGTTTLTVSSTNLQYFTGSTTQTITLPVVSTLVLGQQFEIVNLSTGLVTINSSGGNTVLVLASLTSVVLTVVLVTGTTAASWDSSRYLSILATSGKSVFVKNTLTLQGTDATTMTFPSTSATIARTDAAQTFTGVQTFSSAPVLSTGTVTVGGNTETFPSTTQTLIGRTSTDTLTNKRITRRTASTSGPGASPTTNSDNVDLQIFTALAANITTMTTNLSGTPNTGDFLEFWFTDNGTARTIVWGASFAATTVALPTTTVISTKLRVLFEWGASTWDCLAVA